MRKSLTIRQAGHADAHTIARLSSELGYPADDRQMEERIEVLKASSDDAVLVAEVDGHTVGWTHVTVLRGLEHDPRAELHGLVVSEERHGEGIGRALMDAAETWAREKGMDILRLRTNTVRKGAHAFYERLGYEKVKEQRVYQKPL